MNDRDCDNCVHHSDGGCSVWECSFEQKEDDTISRQAAIDAVCGWCHANCTPCEFFPCGEIKAIQALPPAQPNLQPTCNQLATDTISRQGAIDALDKEYRCTDKSDDWDGLETAMLIIENLSSAQPEQSIAQERYEDLCEYFKDCSDQGRSILNDRKEFKSWLDRMKWHVMECNKLGRELEKLKTAQPEQQWIPCSEPPEEDGVYIVYAPTYSGGSSSAKECHNGVMFSKYKNGKWSIEHGYYSRPNCVKAWKPLDEPWRGEGNEHND